MKVFTIVQKLAFVLQVFNAIICGMLFTNHNRGDKFKKIHHKRHDDI